MLKGIFKIYRVPLILSVTLGIVLVALRIEKETLPITLILLGSILGTFVFDIEYLIHTYFIEKTDAFSDMIRGYVKHRDFRGFFAYVNSHKDDVQEKTLHSGLFQIVLAGVSLFVVSSSTTLLLKALVVSTFLNSIYRLVEDYLEDKHMSWFWSFDIGRNKFAFFGYLATIIGIFIYTLFLA